MKHYGTGCLRACTAQGYRDKCGAVLRGFAAVDNTTMLALDDAALARICIAATALRRRRRQRWLKDLAERVDPPPRRVMRELPKAKGGPTGLRENPQA